MRLGICVFLILLIPLSCLPAAAQVHHPRIYLTSSLLTSVRAKAAAKDPDWKAEQARADKFLQTPVADYCRNCGKGIVYRYQGGGWLDAIQTLGLAYQVTRKPAYADKVIEVLNVAKDTFQAGNLEPISADRGFPSRSAAYGLALGFDWAYDRMDTATREATVQTLNGWFDWIRTKSYQRDGPAYGNYFGGHLLGVFAAGYATAGDNPRAQEMIAWARDLFDQKVIPAFTSGGFAGGYPVESYNYGPNHFGRLFRCLLAVKSATGEELPGTVEYARKVAVNLLYNLKPNRWQSSDEGDFSGDYTGVMSGSLPLLLSAVLAGTKEGHWMQFLYTNLATPAGIPGRASPAERMLFFDPSRPALDYRLSEPVRFRSPGDEHVYVRSSWRDDAVWASFAAGTAVWGDHESRKAGHIAIQRGNDYLLVNSGQWKGQSGVSGRPQAFDLASWRSNTLFFSDQGKYMYGGPAYQGGQAYWGSNQVLAYEDGPGYLYTKADLASAYDKKPEHRKTGSPTLKLFVRSFVHLEPNVFLIFDRAQGAEPTYVKKLYFHFNPNGLPVVTGKQTVSTVGNSTLLMKTLLPAEAVIEVVPDPVSDRNPAPITYRVEVSDSVAGPDLIAFHALAVIERGGAAPAFRAVAVAKDNMAGAMIEDPAAPRWVLLAKDGTPQTDVSYQADEAVGRQGRHLLVDMAPGSYRVIRNGVQMSGRFVASPQGILAFESVGGAGFRVVRISN